MAKEQLVTAIDVGSSKITCLIAEVNEEAEIQIIGVSSVSSRGLKKGVIVDIDQTVDVLSESLEAAERMAGVTISRAYVTINGSHISSVNSQGVVAITADGMEITPNDVDRVIEAAKAISVPPNREIIHIIPRTFTLDKQDGIDDPIGMSGTPLQVETHIITAAVTSVRNLIKCVHQIGLDVENLVFSGIASSESVLTETEKELGVVLVDIGGGTTDIVVFHDGAPLFSSVIKLGGKNITSDIAIGLRVPIEEAEEIKKYISKPKKKPVVSDEAQVKESYSNPNNEMIDISELNIESINKVDRKILVEGIIHPRLEEIVEAVGQEIKKSGYEELVPAGLVICGGGAYTIGLHEIFEKYLRLPIRIGQPTGVSGLIDEIKGSDYAASVGTILHIARSGGGTASFLGSFTKIRLSTEKITAIGNKVKKFFQGFLPK